MDLLERVIVAESDHPVGDLIAVVEASGQVRVRLALAWEENTAWRIPRERSLTGTLGMGRAA